MCIRDSYDSLYEVLSAPVDSHMAILPYGQGMSTFEMYVTTGQDTLARKNASETYWTGLSVKFVAMAPQRT